MKSWSAARRLANKISVRSTEPADWLENTGCGIKWRCTRCPARFQACCPGGGLLLLVAWVSADVRQVLLQQPNARHPPPNPRRPLVSVSSRSRRIRMFRPQLCVCVSRLVTMVCIWCTRSLGRLNFLDLLLRHNTLVGGHPGPRKKADEHSSTR